ncbi:MAG: hypothetical protein WBX01_17385 [Nitrososphaeraceae archaeon]
MGTTHGLTTCGECGKRTKFSLETKNASRSKDQVKGLFFVGDSTVNYSIGTDSAAHSVLLCYPKIQSYLSSR